MADKKLLIIRIICWTAVVLCMSAIFYLSSEDQQASSDRSNKLTVGIAEKAAEIAKENGESKWKQNKARDNTYPLVRNIAHYIEYGALGICLAAAMTTTRIKKFLKVVFAILIGSLYSLSDEIHQKFVPGRSFGYDDLLHDNIGLFIGIFFTFAVIMVVKLIIKNKKSRRGAV